MSVCVHCGSELPPASAFCPACAQPGRAVPVVPAAAPKPPPGLHPLLKQPFRDTLPPQTAALSKEVPLDRRGPREGAPSPVPAAALPHPPLPSPRAAAVPLPGAQPVVAPRVPAPAAPVAPRPPAPPAARGSPTAPAPVVRSSPSGAMPSAVAAVPTSAAPARPAPVVQAAPPPPRPTAPVEPAVRRPTPSTQNWGLQPQQIPAPVPRAPTPVAIPVQVAVAPRAAPPAAIAPVAPEPAVESVQAATEATEAPHKVRAEVAPTWRRLLAWSADVVTLGLLAGLFLWGATALVHHGTPSRQSGLDWLAETLLAYRKLWIPGGLLLSVLAILYLTLFTALGGQTPGKWLLGLRVVDRSGACPSPLRSAVRAALAVGSGVLGLLGFFLVLVDRRGQALHDKLAGTFVVRSQVFDLHPAAARAGGALGP